MKIDKMVTVVVLTVILFFSVRGFVSGASASKEELAMSLDSIAASNVVVSPELKIKEANDSLFEIAVEIIKEFEGWHSAKHHPYVGYGHQLLKGDKFNANITEEFATELLRKDLRQKIGEFKAYGKDSLILGVLAYNIGEWKIKGGYGYKESQLSKSIKNKAGREEIKKHYCSFRMYKGKAVKSIERRRNKEFNNIYL